MYMGMDSNMLVKWEPSVLYKLVARMCGLAVYTVRVHVINVVFASHRITTIS